jgi:hypothetical protein
MVLCTTQGSGCAGEPAMHAEPSSETSSRMLRPDGQPEHVTATTQAERKRKARSAGAVQATSEEFVGRSVDTQKAAGARTGQLRGGLHGSRCHALTQAC